jgi:hypothetical protein
VSIVCPEPWVVRSAKPGDEFFMGEPIDYIGLIACGVFHLIGIGKIVV